MENCSSGEKFCSDLLASHRSKCDCALESMATWGMYKLKEAIEKFCSDLLASHRSKCDCALESMATWRFFSCRKMMESLLVGTVY
jgi:hypothetical protein